MAKENVISVSEIRMHASPKDIWIVVDSVVWDMTSFAPEHPGGETVIYQHAGLDATKAYSEIHPPGLISQTLDGSKRIGRLNESSIDAKWMDQLSSAASASTSVASAQPTGPPPLSTIVSSHDLATAAERALSRKTWAFYSSAATDLITERANRSFLDRVWFRPRVLRNVRDINTKSRILGLDVNLPIFISPAALAKLAHEDGEKALARGAASSGILYCMSTNASYSLPEIVAAVPHGTPLFFQLYVNSDRPKTEALLAEVTRLGSSVRAIFLTVDAPVPGKREADERVRADESLQVAMYGTRATNDARGGGIARSTGKFIDASLCWEDLNWLRQHTKLPIVIKGITSAADAKMALEWGVQGIFVSNHGGRCLDMTPPSILTLLEIHKSCPEAFDHMEVYLDGGIRRGTDILKALCLGATAVGLGRPYLYSLIYGQDGVEHLTENELEMSMKVLGITDLGQVHPGLVNTLDIDHLVPQGIDHPYVKWRPKPRI